MYEAVMDNLKATLAEYQSREQALIEAKEKAEAANRAKSEFLAIVSHEMRLPLTAILGMAQLLSLDCLLPEQLEQVKDIVNASERLLDVVDDLLDLAKLETGQMELQLAPLDLRKLLEETATTLTFQAKAKGLELLVTYDEDAPYLVLGDARAIRQIVLDLVGNALKFTDQGYIVIRVKCEGRTENQAQLVLSIEDTGVGIDAEKLKVILTRFNQGDSVYRRRYSGAGLGLTLSKAYTELMGGKLVVDSQAGKGSIFSCHIPFALQTSATVTSPWEPYRSTVNVLIVDDTLRGEVLRKHIASSLTEVTSGKDALSHLMAAERRSQPYGVVIIDQQLTSTDAITLAQKINSQKGLHIPMLLLLVASAAPAPTAKETAKAAGFFGVIVKPVQPTELLTNLTVAWEKWAERLRTAAKPKSEHTQQRPRILLVEDDRIVQKVHKIMLERLGCEVDVAEDGPRALEIFTKGYDVIIMDVGLPGMSGLEVTTEIRKRESVAKRTPIIAITAFGHEEDRNNCLAAGVDDVAIKPVALEDLTQVLRRWVGVRD